MAGCANPARAPFAPWKRASQCSSTSATALRSRTSASRQRSSPSKGRAIAGATGLKRASTACNAVFSADAGALRRRRAGWRGTRGQVLPADRPRRASRAPTAATSARRRASPRSPALAGERRRPPPRRARVAAKRRRSSPRLWRAPERTTRESGHRRRRARKTSLCARERRASAFRHVAQVLHRGQDVVEESNDFVGRHAVTAASIVSWSLVLKGATSAAGLSESSRETTPSNALSMGAKTCAGFARRARSCFTAPSACCTGASSALGLKVSSVPRRAASGFPSSSPISLSGEKRCTLSRSRCGCASTCARTGSVPARRARRTRPTPDRSRARDRPAEARRRP